MRGYPIRLKEIKEGELQREVKANVVQKRKEVE